MKQKNTQLSHKRKAMTIKCDYCRYNVFCQSSSSLAGAEAAALDGALGVWEDGHSARHGQGGGTQLAGVD